MARRPVPQRDQFPYMLPVQVRWSDFDLLNHVNNVVYYRYFEHLVVTFIGDACGVNWAKDPVIPFAAESSCRFIRPIDTGEHNTVNTAIDAGLRVEHIGNTSVRYGVALFRPGEQDASAAGEWVHVFVNRDIQRPVPIPDNVRAVFERHLVPQPQV